MKLFRNARTLGPGVFDSRLSENVDAPGAALGRPGETADFQICAPRAALAAEAVFQIMQCLAAQTLGDPGARVDHRLATTGAPRPEA
jgi:hypothetical protein